MDDKLTYLQQLLAEELEHFGRFCFVLREEREALASQNTGSIESLVGEKERLYRRLSELASARQDILGTARPDEIRQGLQYLDPNLAVTWDRLLLLVREAHELNQVNGRIIELQLHQNRQAFNLLKGAQDASELYTAAGQTQSANAARDLGSV